MLAHNMPLMVWERTSFSLGRGGFMWPTGLGEQSEHWILVPPTSARLLVPCIHITGTVDSAISHWNSQDVTALMNSPVVSSYKGANYYIILKDVPIQIIIPKAISF